MTPLAEINRTLRQDRNEARERAAALQDQVSKLRAVLKPFAEIGLVHDSDPAGPDAIDAPDLAITPTHVRAARAAISPTGKRSVDQ